MYGNNRSLQITAFWCTMFITETWNAFTVKIHKWYRASSDRRCILSESILLDNRYFLTDRIMSYRIYILSERILSDKRYILTDRIRWCILSERIVSDKRNILSHRILPDRRHFISKRIMLDKRSVHFANHVE